MAVERPVIRHVVLIGLMGAGKTTIGGRVAALLGWPLVDGDDELEQLTGRTAAEIARTHGIEHLHDLEERVALDALTSSRSAVIGPAASVCESAAVRGLLDAPFVVWLTAPAAYLAASARRSSHRPIVERADLEHVLAEQLVERRRLLEGLVDMTLDVSVTAGADAAAAIVDQLGERTI